MSAVDQVIALAKQELGYLEKKDNNLKYLFDKSNKQKSPAYARLPKCYNIDFLQHFPN